MLKRPTAGAFVVPFRVLSRTNRSFLSASLVLLDFGPFRLTLP